MKRTWSKRFPTKQTVQFFFQTDTNIKINYYSRSLIKVTTFSRSHTLRVKETSCAKRNHWPVCFQIEHRCCITIKQTKICLNYRNAFNDKNWPSKTIIGTEIDSPKHSGQCAGIRCRPTTTVDAFESCIRHRREIFVLLSIEQKQFKKRISFKILFKLYW